MKEQIINDQRLITMGDIPTVVKLKEFIDTLDAKYGVDSSDTENTFGLIDLDKALISYLYESNIYFLLFGYSSDIDHLPKYQKVPIVEEAIAISKKGDIAYLGNPFRHQQMGTNISVNKSDVKKLIDLRQLAYDDIKANHPTKPDYPSETLTAKEYDELLESQGFASNTSKFEIEFRIPKYKKFNVCFERLGSNKSPHFTTTYAGWQNQYELAEIPEGELAYDFYRKWDPFHTIEMTQLEFDEMLLDLYELMDEYKYTILNGFLRGE